MTDFDPGEGWWKIDDIESAELLWYPDGGRTIGGMWVREEPVLPLPTEPHTVIRVTWKAAEDEEHMSTVFALTEHAEWQAVPGVYSQRPVPLRERIFSFEVLAVPLMTIDTVVFLNDGNSSVE